ncbi:general secretion pathway protein GspB [Desulfosarcina alkanivorans]|uniref:general secretion pathway protein GspB n=1 Tax=Desulfosarcina alkanivorans TaxID=571177 RepID=UPI0012D345F6|nr:general secretion pathway protein GspB [Desulfosarcina alkanivorans]
MASQQHAPSATAVEAGAPGRAADDAPPTETASPLPPARPPKQSPVVGSPAPTPMVPSAPQPTVNARRETLAPQPAPSIAPALPEPRPAKTVEPVPEPPDSGKTFRNDPRIDLQALVWAPEAAARFVVINNRLIKEGGSLDNIVVVKINPDDVLLAEGANRWYVEFKVR